MGRCGALRLWLLWGALWGAGLGAAFELGEALRGLRGENARLEGTLRNLSRALGQLRARLREPSALKALWAQQPVLTVSFGIAAVAIISPFVSPYAKYSGMINRATPYQYPVPLRDDGSLPNVPSHPCDPEGPNLEWLKRL